MAEILKLWDLIKKDEYDAVISDVTFEEINKNRNLDKVETLLNLIAEIPYERVDINDECRSFADMV